MVKMEIFPWVTNYLQYRNIIANDLALKGPLKAMRVPRGNNGVQYKIRGSNIIKYLVIKDEQKK